MKKILSMLFKSRLSEKFTFPSRLSENWEFEHSDRVSQSESNNKLDWVKQNTAERKNKNWRLKFEIPFQAKEQNRAKRRRGISFLNFLFTQTNNSRLWESIWWSEFRPFHCCAIAITTDIANERARKKRAEFCNSFPFHFVVHTNSRCSKAHF